MEPRPPTRGRPTAPAPGHIFDKWGDDIPKPLPLLYSGLNGASLKGAVRASAREAYGGPDDIGFEDGRVLDHPILRELALFQTRAKRFCLSPLPSSLQGHATCPRFSASVALDSRGEAGA